MAYMEVKNEGVGGGSPTPSKPKIKLNKKTIIIGGVVLMIVFFVLKKLVGGSAQPETQTAVLESAGSEYGTNNVDVAGQLQNMQQMIDQSVGTTLSQFQADMQSQINASNNDVLSTVSTALNDSATGFTSSMSDFQSMFNTSLQEQQEKFNLLNQSNNEQFETISQKFNTLSNLADSNAFATSNTGILQIKSPNLSAYRDNISDYQIGEIQRKAEQGIALSAPNAVKQALYDEYQQYYKAETIRKANIGESLLRPNEWKNTIYNQVVNQNKVKDTLTSLGTSSVTTPKKSVSQVSTKVGGATAKKVLPKTTAAKNVTKKTAAKKVLPKTTAAKNVTKKTAAKKVMG